MTISVTCLLPLSKRFVRRSAVVVVVVLIGSCRGGGSLYRLKSAVSELQTFRPASAKHCAAGCLGSRVSGFRVQGLGFRVIV